MKMDDLVGKPSQATWSSMYKLKRGLSLVYIENAPFEKVLELFDVKCTRFKEGPPGMPRYGRHVLLMLPSGRYASVTNYDGFPWSLVFSLEVSRSSPYDVPIVYMADLMALLGPLCLPMPDKSKDGGYKWIAPSEA
jgi:hypothetical protein